MTIPHLVAYNMNFTLKRMLLDGEGRYVMYILAILKKFNL